MNERSLKEALLDELDHHRYRFYEGAVFTVDHKGNANPTNGITEDYASKERSDFVDRVIKRVRQRRLNEALSRLQALGLIAEVAIAVACQTCGQPLDPFCSLCQSTRRCCIHRAQMHVATREEIAAAAAEVCRQNENRMVRMSLRNLGEQSNDD